MINMGRMVAWKLRCLRLRTGSVRALGSVMNDRLSVLLMSLHLLSNRMPKTSGVWAPVKRWRRIPRGLSLGWLFGRLLSGSVCEQQQ